jgi:hypothetical protein
MIKSQKVTSLKREPPEKRLNLICTVLPIDFNVVMSDMKSNITRKAIARLSSGRKKLMVLFLMSSNLLMSK